MVTTSVPSPGVSFTSFVSFASFSDLPNEWARPINWLACSRRFTSLISAVSRSGSVAHLSL